MNNGAISEVSDLVIGAVPVDLQAAALNGLFFNLKNCDGLNAILVAAIGTAGDDPVISLEQAKDASGTDAKSLNIYKVDYKVGATGFNSTTDLWQNVSTIDRDNPVVSYDSAAVDGAENALVLSTYIRQTDLDIANDFTHVRLNCADVGANAQLGAILYIPSGRAYRGAHNVSHLA